MSRSGCQIAGLVAAGLIVGCAIGIWPLLELVTSGPLHGETSHDFGDVDVAVGAPVELHHTFHLVNSTGQPIVIAAIKPDCGCVSVAAGNHTIQPGQSFDLPVTLNFTGKTKTAAIQIDMGEAGVQTLYVHATGHFKPRLYAAPGALSVRDDEPASIMIMADIFESYDPPHEPQLTPTRGLTASFSGWNLHFEPKDTKLAPCQWEGTLKVWRTSDPLADQPQVLIDVKPDMRLTIPITGKTAGPESQPEDHQH